MKIVVKCDMMKNINEIIGDKNDMKKPYFPMFVDISQKKIVVVGGGTIATRRVETLLAFAEDILVVSPKVTEKIRVLCEAGDVRWMCSEYCPAVLEGADIVLAATDDPVCNERIVGDCRERGILVNTSHKKEMCDFYFPAIAKNETIVAGITASGKNHTQARRAREEIERILKRME